MGDQVRPRECGLETRHAPSWHCRDARVYGHTTTIMHEIEYISPIEYIPLPPRPLSKQYSLLIGLRRGSVAENRNLSALPQKETPILAKPVIDHLVNRVASVTRGSG